MMRQHSGAGMSKPLSIHHCTLGSEFTHLKQRKLQYNTKLHLSIGSTQQHAAANVIFATLCAAPRFFVIALGV